MQALTLQQVRSAMDLFNMRLSSAAQKSPDELDILAAMILDDLLEERWTSERFANACRKHRKLSSFLPTTADLIAADKAARDGAPYHEQVALPTWEIPADEQCAKNLVKARELLAALAKGVKSPLARTQ